MFFLPLSEEELDLARLISFCCFLFVRVMMLYSSLYLFQIYDDASHKE